MSSPIEDYAMIGDCQSGALISRDGSIDWLCLPRFDSGACFAALLDTPEAGRWLLQPKGEIQEIRRRYRGESLILETDFRTAQGMVTVIDFMPPRGKAPDLVRTVVGREGTVDVQMELIIRFHYGSQVPWVRKMGKGLTAISGPDALFLTSDVELRGEDFRTRGDFTVSEGEKYSFVLTWYPSHEKPMKAVDPDEALESTEEWWQEWASRCTIQGPWREPVLRSLITLKALTYQPTGGIVAALTTSLPEELGGIRNWDYRYCWMRDATFTLSALMEGGYEAEATAWCDWLLRAVAGQPAQAQTLYGIDGQRWMTEMELPWLEGYENSRPVRIGNAAATQLQLDLFGEVMDTIYLGLKTGIDFTDNSWRVQRKLLEHLEEVWELPDHGIWEIRTQPRQLTHSKVMCWVAFDRAVKAVEEFGLEGDVDRWRRLRDKIHAQVCERGFNSKMNSFVESYDSTELDASLLTIPLVGFLPPEDPRVHGTIRAIEQNLLHDGFVMRYQPHSRVDGLEGGEATFLLCTFWLVDNYAITGQMDKAISLFERLLSLQNDVGLLSEEYDPRTKRFLGNFPQAFSHVALVNSALYVAGDHHAEALRGEESSGPDNEA